MVVIGAHVVHAVAGIKRVRIMGKNKSKLSHWCHLFLITRNGTMLCFFIALSSKSSYLLTPGIIEGAKSVPWQC